jgi:hypothetical protein
LPDFFLHLQRFRCISVFLSDHREPFCQSCLVPNLLNRSNAGLIEFGAILRED